MCAKKVEIDIRVCLNKLPTVLIAHLKRIVFDFDTFENKKINTRYGRCDPTFLSHIPSRVSPYPSHARLSPPLVVMVRES